MTGEDALVLAPDPAPHQRWAGPPLGPPHPAGSAGASCLFVMPAWGHVPALSTQTSQHKETSKVTGLILSSANAALDQTVAFARFLVPRIDIP